MVSTFDGMDTTNWDRLSTYDDPMYDAILDVTYAQSTVTRGGPKATVNWGAGDIIDTLDSPFSRDNFTRTVSAGGWGQTEDGRSWTGNFPAQLSVNGSSGLISVAAVNTEYQAWITGLIATDFDAMVKISTPVLFTGDRGIGFIVGRSQDPNNQYRFRLDFNIDQVIGWGIEQVVGGLATTIAGGLVGAVTHQVNGYYWLRAQAYGSTLRLKVWADGAPEPEDWEGSVIDTTWVSGLIGVRGYLTPGNTNALPVAFSFDSLFIGANTILDVNAVSVGMSLDDGLPSQATNTANLGVGELAADLAAPIGEDPSKYYSTFRKTAPYWDFPRDTAGLVVNTGAVADDGVRDTRLFTGQMVDMPLDGDTAKLKGISRQRLKLSTQVQPPAIHALYEGCDMTWPISFALMKSGVHAAPPPLPGCRLYIPFHGSTHPMVPEDNGNILQVGWVQHTPASNGYARPSFVDGPHISGIMNQINALGANSSRDNTTLRWAPGEDIFSQVNSSGRLEFWVRGDAVDIAASPEPTTNRLVANWLYNASINRYIEFSIGGDRIPYLWLRDGVNEAIIRGPALATDGQWHFLGAAWDIAGNQLWMQMDDKLVSNTTAGTLSVANLPLAEDINQGNLYQSFLPISQLQLAAGKVARGGWTPWSNDPQYYQPTARLRPSIMQLEGLAEPQPREAFEMISSYGQSELAKVGLDANDVFQYLPAPYWAEAAQTEWFETLSTDTNLGLDFLAKKNVTKIFNQISVTYKESAVQEVFTPVYQSSEIIPIPGGQSVLLNVPLSGNAIEMRGLTLTIRDTTGNPPQPNENYIIFNSFFDGTGTYATAASPISAKVIAWTPGDATIVINNTGGTQWWVANNANMQSVQLCSKTMVSRDATVTARDDYSIAQRGTRYLPVTLPAIQHQIDAQIIANELVARLTKPRVTFTSSVFADPRRYPGQLVWVSDPDGTGIDDQFRIMGVTNTQTGENLTQALYAERALPVLVWGEGVWGDTVWGP